MIDDVEVRSLGTLEEATSKLDEAHLNLICRISHALLVNNGGTVPDSRSICRQNIGMALISFP